MLEVKIVPEGFKEAQKALEGVKMGFPKAAQEAISRGLLAGQTAAAKGIAARYTITSTEVKNNINIKNASWTNLEGHLNISGAMLPLGTFKISVGHVKLSRGPKRQVISATIRKGAKTVVKGAFQLPSGRVMERRQTEKYPIWPVSTISVAHMAGQTEVAESIQARLNEVTNTRLQHNVQQALTGKEE